VSKQKKTDIKVKIQDAYYKNRLKELVHLLQQLSNAGMLKYISVALPLENIRGMLYVIESGVVNEEREI
jgi:hypothetical protein